MIYHLLHWTYKAAIVLVNFTSIEGSARPSTWNSCLSASHSYTIWDRKSWSHYVLKGTNQLLGFSWIHYDFSFWEVEIIRNISFMQIVQIPAWLLSHPIFGRHFSHNTTTGAAKAMTLSLTYMTHPIRFTCPTCSGLRHSLHSAVHTNSPSMQSCLNSPLRTPARLVRPEGEAVQLLKKTGHLSEDFSLSRAFQSVDLFHHSLSNTLQAVGVCTLLSRSPTAPMPPEKWLLGSAARRRSKLDSG